MTTMNTSAPSARSRIAQPAEIGSPTVIWPFHRPRPSLPPALAARLQQLAARPVREQTLDDSWVVVDVETGGLNPRVDPLLAIGAIQVTNNAIVMAPTCEVRLRQLEATATDNILVHGITTGQQLNGQEPAQAMLDWLEFAGGQPRLAYHAAFDQLALERACQASLGLKDPAIWLDLAVLAPLLVPRGPGFDRPLDDWLAYFHISVYQRHGALADAYATAQLWLALLPAARAQKLTRLKQLTRFSRQVRWLNTHPG
jgi:DNA polymerase III subunit epsilon